MLFRDNTINAHTTPFSQCFFVVFLVSYHWSINDFKVHGCVSFKRYYVAFLSRIFLKEDRNLSISLNIGWIERPFSRLLSCQTHKWVSNSQSSTLELSRCLCLLIYCVHWKPVERPLLTSSLLSKREFHCNRQHYQYALNSRTTKNVKKCWCPFVLSESDPMSYMHNRGNNGYLKWISKCFALLDLPSKNIVCMHFEKN